MASQQNFFALLDGDDENDDPMAVIARAASPAGPEKPPREAKKQQQPPLSSAAQHQAAAKLPGKPLPPAQAVREAQQAQLERGRGRGGRGGRGGGRGAFSNRERDREGGFGRQGGQGSLQVDRGNYDDRNYGDNRENNGGGRGGFSDGGVGIPYYRDPPVEDREGVPPFEGGRFRGRGRGRGRGYLYSGDGEERSRTREYDRRSGTGRGTEMRRNGFGPGNWGSETDQEPLQEFVEGAPVEEEKPLVESGEKQPEEQATAEPANVEEKKVEEEDNVLQEMTLEEYERLMVEKRKSLEALKPEIRKVALDKDFESMQVVDRRHDDGVLQQGVDIEKAKKKLTSEREEKSRRSVSINEFLKPADGEYYSPTGRRGRGRGRGGDRGGYRGGFGGGYNNVQQSFTPRIEDPGQFPTLSGK